ncbi:MAG: glutamate--tRNA ligase [Deltaproteobacteria bacterium]|nr:glutamate--tRNA ligase [Deltaproteobacteria bacterium]
MSSTNNASPGKGERVRFAPSPTGYLHIGGVRTALFNWLWARKTGGTFILRIEDTDQERSTEESRKVILDSMKWLGLLWDEGPEVGGDHGPYTQMERLALYREYADKLIAAGKAYRCTCTKAQLDVQREELKAKDPKATFRYPGTCRDANHPADSVHVVRFKTPTHGVLTYHDMVFGKVSTPNAAQYDFVLLRTDGIPLYNFGAVVDDITMGITLVARGRDHMVNTPPQIMLYEALGAKPPRFAHLPMMLAASGEKLSKRHGAVSVEEYQKGGYTPTALLNYLVRFGWSHGDQEVFSLDEMVEAFDWEHCNKADGKFDPKKLLAINQEHLKQERLTPSADYETNARWFLAARGLTDIDTERLQAAIPLVRPKARTYVELADLLDFFFRDEPVFDDKAAAKFLVAENVERLRAAADLVETCEAWTLEAITAAFNAWLAEQKLEIKDVAQPARVALTGRTASPGIYETIHVLGREPSVKRLRSGAARAGRDGAARAERA